MSKQISFWLLFMFLSQSALANHIFGGELVYSHIQGNTYRIELVLYGDCSSSSGAYTGLYNSSPVIVIKNKISPNFFNNYDSINLSIQNPIGQEITPLCPSELGNSSCNGGSLVGVRKFIYAANYTLPNISGSFTEWNFEFHGNQNPTSNLLAGRSALITNLTINPSTGSLLNLRAYLNRSFGENSSPQYTSVPTPFYCNNKNQVYNLGAIDAASDILDYALVPGLENAGQGQVTYRANYSATNPLAVGSPISFSSTTGEMQFTPNSQQNSIVVYQVNERRNGVLVGSSMREMTFVVLNSCSNTAPNSIVSSSGGTASIQGQTIRACPGIPLNLSFNVSDSDANNVNITYNGLPSSATASIAGNGTQTPVLNFNWANPVTGTYVLFINMEDDGCPISVRQTVAYTIIIEGPQAPTVNLIDPTNCIGPATIQFGQQANSSTPYDLFVLDASGNIIRSYFNRSSTITDTFAIGNYQAYIRPSGLSCNSNTTNFTVADGGTFPYPPTVVSPVYYCRNDQAVALSASAAGGFSPQTIFYRNNLNGQSSTSPPVPSTSSTGIFYYDVTAQFKTCLSAPARIEVFVTDPPGNNFSFPSPICQYDTVLIRYTGNYSDSDNVNILWDFANGVVVDSGSTFGEVSVTFPFSGNYNIGIDQINENFCDGTPNKSRIQVLPSTLVELYGDTSVCAYEEFTISNTSPINSSSSYTWGFPNDAVVSFQNDVNATLYFNSPGRKLVSLTAANSQCSYTDYIYITVHPKPEVQLNIDGNSELCLGDTVIIRTSEDVEVTFNPPVWIRPDLDTSNLYYLVVGAVVNVDVYATSTFGCKDTANIVVENIVDCCKYFIPNAFTPNNDGTNDVFEVYFEGNPKEYELQIYNRWGELMYGSLKKYGNWDGSFKGTPVDNGTYYYIFRGRCYENNREIIESGDINLLR